MELVPRWKEKAWRHATLEERRSCTGTQARRRGGRLWQERAREGKKERGAGEGKEWVGHVGRLRTGDKRLVGRANSWCLLKFRETEYCEVCPPDSLRCRSADGVLESF